MKIYINNANENWVVDRFQKEWNQFNSRQARTYLLKNKIIWLISPWTWKSVPKYFLKRNKVLCTIHHIDEEKFTDEEKANFYYRDQFVDAYHVISDKTKNQVLKLTEKKIYNIPFWANQNLWFEIKDKTSLRKKYGISEEDFLIGSFQRDTEGSDLKSPKLSKGPDSFVEIAKYFNKVNPNTVILLTGKRRQYIKNRLDYEKIKYKYLEMVSFETLNELYNLLNLYIVSSRYEGGPQSIIECSLNKTPIISTDVGIASQILSPESIFDMNNFKNSKPNVEFSYQNIKNLLIPEGFNKFNEMFKEL